MCAIFGLLDYGGTLKHSQRVHIIQELGEAAEMRGIDATGIAFFQRKRLSIQKAPKPAHRMKYRIPKEVKYIMGHTRMTTQGDAKKNYNNHPFSGKAGDQQFALAHNGVLYNDRYLRKSCKLPKTEIETDSYVAVQLLEQEKEVSFNSICKMTEKIEGHFTFTILDQNNNLYFVKGENPLTIFHYSQLGIYLYASTEMILQSALIALEMDELEPEIIEPWEGDILKIDRYGEVTSSQFILREEFPSRMIYPIRRYAIPYCQSQQEYIQNLKAVAWAYGYDPLKIDALIADGFSEEDIEEMLYGHAY